MSRTRRAFEEAQDVVAGRSRPSVRELFDLIHAINPTARVDERGRGAQTARDYQLKARLQSLLVRRHGDELRVRLEDDGTIAIAHRYSNRDACHAQLDTLDDDARAWVRWQLDTSEEAPGSSTHGARAPAMRSERGDGHELEPGVADDGSDPLERGRQALAEYDFELAVSLFREALAESGGVEPARALLEVLVDSLAQDAEALALEAVLDAEARADDEVRSLLGLAAARIGEAERAHQWLKRAKGPRCADAWSVLARAAIAAGALEDAERAAHALEALDGGHPELAELRAAMSARRAELRRPDEEALAAAVAAGDDDAAEERARAILARWPDSAVAGRTLAAITERRRARSGESHRQAAREALDRGDLAAAREQVQRAMGLGVDARELLGRIDEAEAEARALHDAARVDDVCAALREDERRGLARFLDLPSALRARVIAGVVDSAGVRWLDELAPADRSKLREPERGAVVDAVLAFREAREAADAGDPERALERLDRHAELERLREARALRARARDAVTTRRAQAAATALEAAEFAWDAGDATTAARLVEELDRRALPPELRTRADRLADVIARRGEREKRMQRIEQLLASGELIAARRELELLMSDAEHDPPWAEARLETARAGLRDRWHVRTSIRTPWGPRELGELIGRLPLFEMPQAWASADGHVVLAAVHERHLFIAAFEVGRDRAIVHHVETPAPLGRHAVRVLDGDRMWIAGETHVLQLDWRTAEIVRWESLRAFVGEGALIERLFVSPAARTLWIETRQDREWSTRIIDLERWSVVRTLAGSKLFVSIPGDEPLFAAFERDVGAVFYGGRGGTAGALFELRGRRVSELARHPDHAGYIAAASRPDVDDDLSLFEVVPGRPASGQVLEDSDPEAPSTLVSRRGHGRAYAYSVGSNGPTLAALRTGVGGLEITTRVRAPYELTFAHDPTSRRVFVVWDTADGAHVSELCEELPSFGEGLAREALPSVAPYFMCASTGRERFVSVTRAVQEGRWNDARAELEAIDVDELGDHHREHYHHLLGLVFARLGEPAKARAIWDEGRTYRRPEAFISCQLETCLEIVKELGEGPTGEGSRIEQLRRVMAQADERRARDDTRGALAALRVRTVYLARERQSLARLADAWLALPELPGDAAWFDKAQALAQLLAVAEDRSHDLPIPGAWDDDRIAEIAARARRWLAGDRDTCGSGVFDDPLV